jgi:hypothetical protein
VESISLVRSLRALSPLFCIVSHMAWKVTGLSVCLQSIIQTVALAHFRVIAACSVLGRSVYAARSVFERASMGRWAFEQDMRRMWQSSFLRLKFNSSGREACVKRPGAGHSTRNTESFLRGCSTPTSSQTGTADMDNTDIHSVDTPSQGSTPCKRHSKCRPSGVQRCTSLETPLRAQTPRAKPRPESTRSGRT